VVEAKRRFPNLQEFCYLQSPRGDLKTKFRGSGEVISLWQKMRNSKKSIFQNLRTFFNIRAFFVKIDACLTILNFSSKNHPRYFSENNAFLKIAQPTFSKNHEKP
jgi:hypothetical protein